ncbi:MULTISPECIES: hypothetical protein [Kaistia]|uniref:Uncharacterized protein n=1 Tax=Kaistia nematophila TaxID=2994654 RepID=A0A9X3EB75_9HYPH|nr:hypothetical protein [Kaistia nematophila]MCX5569575.1 hypothetical protein [Kaistia nematophila]
MPEIVRRMFLEGKDVVAEEQDWKARGLPPDVRGWSAYCVFLTGRDPEKLEKEILKALPRATLNVIPSQNPAGLWLRGAHWELCQAADALKL